LPIQKFLPAKQHQKNKQQQQKQIGDASYKLKRPDWKKKKKKKKKKEKMEPRKRRAASSHIACDHCRK